MERALSGLLQGDLAGINKLCWLLTIPTFANFIGVFYLAGDRLGIKDAYLSKRDLMAFL